MDGLHTAWDRPATGDVAEADEAAPRELRAGPSPRGFAIGLYLEHLEDASFLYEQRLALLDDPRRKWRDLAELEERLVAHVDALTVGGDLALAVCRQQAFRGEAGELYAALRAAGRQCRWDLAEATLGALDAADKERMCAAEDALCHDAPPEWEGGLERLLTGIGPAGPIAAATLGYRRMQAGPALLRALEQTGGAPPPAPFVRALGRLRYAPAREVLFSSLRHDDVKADATFAALRLGEPAVVQFAQGQRAPWAAHALGLGGGRSAVPRLLALTRDAPTPHLVLALGLLGDPSAVPDLLGALSVEALAEAAALALFLITGAELFEEAFLPEEGDVDGRLDEREAGAPSGGRDRGVAYTRVAQNAKTWTAWWDAHGRAFTPGARFRNGVLATPAATLASLRSEHLPRSLRQLLYEELAVRYDCDVPFEADLFVTRQEEALDRIEGWVRAGTFQPGDWYFAGNHPFR